MGLLEDKLKARGLSPNAAATSSDPPLADAPTPPVGSDALVADTMAATDAASRAAFQTESQEVIVPPPVTYAPPTPPVQPATAYEERPNSTRKQKIALVIVLIAAVLSIIGMIFAGISCFRYFFGNAQVPEEHLVIGGTTTTTVTSTTTSTTTTSTTATTTSTVANTTKRTSARTTQRPNTTQRRATTQKATTKTTKATTQPTVSSKPATIIKGDVNADGELNMRDVQAALYYAMGSATPPSDIVARGDMDGDGHFGMTDAAIIRQMVIGG